MNPITAACGHQVTAVGAPGSPARLRCERACEACRCPACQGDGIVRSSRFSDLKRRPDDLQVECLKCNGKGWVKA